MLTFGYLFSREEYQNVDFMSRNRQDITWKSELRAETPLAADLEETKPADENAKYVEEYVFSQYKQAL